MAVTRSTSSRAQTKALIATGEILGLLFAALLALAFGVAVIALALIAAAAALAVRAGGLWRKAARQRRRDEALAVIAGRLDRLLEHGWSVHPDVPHTVRDPNATVDFAVASPTGVPFAVLHAFGAVQHCDVKLVAEQASWLDVLSRSNFRCQSVVCVSDVEDLDVEVGVLQCSPDKLVARMRAQEARIVNEGPNGLTRLHSHRPGESAAL